MNHFELRDGADGLELHAEDVALAAIAEACGTPTYVYSRATIERHYRVMDEALGGVPNSICYAVKAASNLAILGLLAKLGAGFDIVSVGELERVLAAGGLPERVMFSGVGKRDDEIERALRVGIRCFNVESAWELERIEAVAERVGRRAPISVRVNPDVDPQTHAYIATGLRTSKFGVPMVEAQAMYRRAAASPHLHVVGIDCHIGSQITQVEPLAAALDRVLELVDALADEGIAIEHVDMGGGLGITYKDEEPAPPAAVGRAYAERLGPRGLELVVEPGRLIVGNAGVLLMRVLGVKTGEAKTFVIVDAAMNDNIRPSLYGAWQQLEPVCPSGRNETTVDVVGPICESGDFFARDRVLPEVRAGELLAMRSAGAYGFTMASTYNSRPRAAEVMVDGSRLTVVRERESLRALWAGERLLDEDDAGPSAI
ncbi:MAG: diaminopimelate decarboxylase [Deltaproteobacteria bacterium]|nr:diaminopimelate decarboxylase [Deltaproteobacteria bacterium]